MKISFTPKEGEIIRNFLAGHRKCPDTRGDDVKFRYEIVPTGMRVALMDECRCYICCSACGTRVEVTGPTTGKGAHKDLCRTMHPSSV